jgi:aspartate aminotransferase-like enzyme
MGFGILAEKDNRAVTLSNVIYPQGVDDVKFRTILAAEGAMVAGGLAAYAGKMFRLGHMGNIDKHTLVSTIAAIERTAVKCGMNVEFGSGLKVIQEGIMEL